LLFFVSFLGFSDIVGLSFGLFLPFAVHSIVSPSMLGLLDECWLVVDSSVSLLVHLVISTGFPVSGRHVLSTLVVEVAFVIDPAIDPVSSTTSGDVVWFSLCQLLVQCDVFGTSVSRIALPSLRIGNVLLVLG
jgi:hypothetical protein